MSPKLSPPDKFVLVKKKENPMLYKVQVDFGGAKNHNYNNLMDYIGYFQLLFKGNMYKLVVTRGFHRLIGYQH